LFYFIGNALTTDTTGEMWRRGDSNSCPIWRLTYVNRSMHLIRWLLKKVTPSEEECDRLKYCICR